uniref:Uncharacterized protein n=1 Tax=Rheinheimera sp. BAL341 TaxID=1708203 RepID=A0A486XVI6_9GAMM
MAEKTCQQHIIALRYCSKSVQIKGSGGRKFQLNATKKAVIYGLSLMVLFLPLNARRLQ